MKNESIKRVAVGDFANIDQSPFKVWEHCRLRSHDKRPCAKISSDKGFFKMIYVKKHLHVSWLIKIQNSRKIISCLMLQLSKVISVGFSMGGNLITKVTFPFLDTSPLKSSEQNTAW